MQRYIHWIDNRSDRLQITGRRVGTSREVREFSRDEAGVRRDTNVDRNVETIDERVDLSSSEIELEAKFRILRTQVWQSGNHP